MDGLDFPREDVPFLPLLAGLAAWSLYRLAVDRIVRWWSPGFYNTLRGNYEKYLFFLGMLLGLIVKPIPLIGCGLAVWKTSPEDDIAGFRRPMNPSQQFCWGSRTVVYISELPHYLHVPEMVLHHLLTLFGMGLVAKFNISRRGLDLSLAALWSEIVYSLRNVLKWTGYLDTRPDLDWRLTFYGTLFLFVTRAPTTIVGFAMIPANGLQAGPALVIAMAYGFHLAYIFRITYIRLKKSGVLQVEESGVFRVQFGDHFTMTSTTLLTGLAFMSTQVSLVLLYSLNNTGLQAAGIPELINLMWNSLLAGICGLAGSRLIARFLQGFARWHRVSLLYLQYDLVVAALVLCLSPTIESSIDKTTLLLCLVLSSSLTKAIYQYASHLACLQKTPEESICQLSSSRKTLNCSIINLCQYFLFVFLFASGSSSIAGAALKSFMVQMVIEAAADSAMTKTSTSISLGSLAAVMTAWRSSVIEISSPAYRFELHDNQTIDSVLSSNRPSSLPNWVQILLQNTLVIGGLYVLFFTTMDHLCNLSWNNKPRLPGLPKLRTIGLLAVTGWAGYIVYLFLTGQTPESQNKGYSAAEILAREPPICSLLLSWHFWAALSVSATVPTALAHMWQPKVVGQEEMPDEAGLEPKAKEA